MRADLQACVVDQQAQVVDAVSELLKPGGLFCLADPNGFSKSFNRLVLFEDPYVAVSYFNEFLEAAALLERHDMEILKVFRQARLRDSMVSNVKLNLDSLRDKTGQEYLDCAGNVFHHDEWAKDNMESWEDYRPHDARDEGDLLLLDYDDIHLGYIIIARKMAPRKAREYVPIFHGKLDR